jgi:hypothetical protein
MKGKIEAAVDQLDAQLVSQCDFLNFKSRLMFEQEENKDDGGSASTEAVTKAKEVIAAAKEAIR